MKKKKLKAIGGACLTILAVTLFAHVWVSAQADNSNEPTLVGSWDVRVTARDCETGAPIPFIPVFPAIMTYQQGGTMQETDLGGPGLVRLPGHGIWERQTGREYSSAFRFLNFNPDRSFAGSNVIRANISLSQSGDEYNSTDTLQILDANGDVVATGCATQTATRFK
jgi:hypothetical protein